MSDEVASGLAASGDDANEFKSCCAAIYESAAIRYLLADSWHPGGVALTDVSVRRCRSARATMFWM